MAILEVEKHTRLTHTKYQDRIMHVMICGIAGSKYVRNGMVRCFLWTDFLCSMLKDNDYERKERE